MEFDTYYKEDLDHHVYKPILLPNYIKPEIDDDFSWEICPSKGFFHDNYPTLDQFSFTGSSSYNYPTLNTFCDPFLFPSAKNFDIYDQPKPFEELGGSSFLQNSSYLHVDGVFNNPKATPQALNAFDHLTFGQRSVVVPDEGSCVTTDNKIFATKKHFGKKDNASTKASKLKKKLKSSKGQWTAEEDRYIN